MKIVLEGAQRRYFFEKGFIELESAFSEMNMEKVLGEIDKTLSLRACDRSYPEKVFKAGRDLWRDSKEIKSFCCKNTFADMARGALDIDRAQLAYDQYLEPARYPYYGKTFPETATLEDVSNVQGLEMGICICISGTREPDSLLFPHAPGNVTLIRPSKEVEYYALDESIHQRFLLLTLASPDAIYVPRELDPCSHTLKNYGYVFGDRLERHGHPAVVK